MLQKFALAFKTKTIEFFGEEEEDDDGDSISAFDLDPAAAATEEEIITGQRVVVLKPDAPRRRPPPSPHAVLPSLFAAAAGFRAAHLHLQASHAPSFDAAAAAAADRAAVSQLRRLSDLKRLYTDGGAAAALPSRLAAEVQENQCILRALEIALDRLQPEIDRRDAEAAQLRDRLRESEISCRRLERRLEIASSPPPEEKVEALLTVGVFDSVLRDSCRDAHRFARALMDSMRASSGLDFDSAADSIHPGVSFVKPGHRRYAVLSFVFLAMFGGFESSDYSGGSATEDDGVRRRRSSLRQFIEHSAADALELVEGNHGGDFASFCRRKYQNLVCSAMESPPPLELHPSAPLFKPFVAMASSMWLLHKLAWAYDPAVEIFQVGKGDEFSSVYMESVVKYGGAPSPPPPARMKKRVGFTVVPGFWVGKTIIQSRVYLDGSKQQQLQP